MVKPWRGLSIYDQASANYDLEGQKRFEWPTKGFASRIARKLLYKIQVSFATTMQTVAPGEDGDLPQSLSWGGTSQVQRKVVELV
jgi:hypothetical protein